MDNIESEIKELKKRLSALEEKEEKRTGADADKVAARLLKKLEAYTSRKTL